MKSKLATWMYNFLTGTPVTQTIRRLGRKVQRNDPCQCRSGEKFKLCCGRA